MKKKILVIGRTASGKTSIVRETCKNLGLKLVKSYTTRLQREEELIGETDHYFISEEDVKQFEDNMIAYTEINGAKYFVTREELNNADVYVIDPNGINYLKEKTSGEYKFVTIYIRTSPNIIKERIVKRGDDLKVFQSRVLDEDEQFKQFEKEMSWDYHLLNNDSFERAVKIMCRFLKKEFNL